MLPTYTSSPVCRQPTAHLALYVANLQTPSPVCCQPTAPPSPVCALLALYGANLQTPSPVCCQPTALLALYVADLEHT